MQYLDGMKDFGIILQRDGISLTPEIYVDTDFASLKDAKSIGGYICLFARLVIGKKQTHVALLTTEAKYMALTPARKHIIWLRKLFTELGFPFTNMTQIHCNSSQTLIIQQNTPEQNIYMWNIASCVTSNEALITYVKLEDSIADIMTKALPNAKPIHLWV